jgi:4-hydroxybenzoate polyprenyltransferase
MSGPAGTQAYERFAAAVDRFVVWVEKDRLPLFGVFLYVIAVSVIRDISEYYLLDQAFVTTAHPWVFSIAHHVAFYAVVFLGLVFLLSAFSGRGVKRTINYVSMFYWIIILPPWIDHFVGGLNQNYAYFSATDFLNALFHFSGEAFHIGQAGEVVVILFALFAYSIWTQRDKLATLAERSVTVLRIGLLIFFTFLFMFIMGTPQTFMPVGFVNGLPQFPAFDLTRYYQYHLLLYTYYLAAGIVIALVITYFAYRKDFSTVLHSMRPAQTLFFAAIVAAGIVTGWRLDSGLDLANNILQDPFYVNLGFAGMTVLSALLTWQVSTIWNDLSDQGYDKPGRKSRTLASGIIDPKTLAQISMILVAVTVASSFLLSIQQGLLILLILGLSWAYSFNPVRFKDHILSPLLIGLGTFLVFLYGYLAPYSEIALYTSSDIYYPHLTGNVFIPQLTAEGFLIGFFMFLGLVIGSMVTDIDGYEEDKRARVRTIYTSLGVERGSKVVAALIFLAALTPLVLFHEPLDMIAFPLVGAVAALTFLGKKAARPVFLIALIGLLYAALRYLGLF